MTQITSTSPSSEQQPYSVVELRAVLNEWHRASDERPAPFPGPLAAKDELAAWVHDIRRRSEDRGIPHQQWANAIISWIPSAAEGKRGFREEMLDRMREKRARGDWEQVRFWRWEGFKYLFFEMCGQSPMLLSAFCLILKNSDSR
jgi:hypothetical protein